MVGQIIPTKLLHIRKDSDMALSGEPLKHIKGRLHGCRARVVGVIHHRKSSVGIDLLTVFEAMESQKTLRGFFHRHTAFTADRNGCQSVHHIVCAHDVQEDFLGFSRMNSRKLRFSVHEDDVHRAVITGFPGAIVDCLHTGLSPGPAKHIIVAV